MDEIVSLQKLVSYKYLVDATIINAGKEVELKGFEISDISVENNFTELFFPVLRMELFVKSDLFYRIQRHRKKVKVKIVVRKFAVKEDDDFNKDFTGEKKFTSSILFQGIFQPFMIDVDPPKRRDLEEGTNPETTKDNIDILNNDTGVPMPLELYLFNLEHLNINKKILNAIVSDNNILNTVGYIFNEVGVKSVIMNSVQNKEVYNQILIPPLNFKHSIAYLGNSFGIYKTGIRQFFDFNHYYLLSNDLTEVPVEQGEYENVFINVGKLSNSESFKEGCYKDNKNKCYVVNLPMTVNFSTQGMFSKELEGNKMKVYEMKEIRDKTSYNEGSGTFTFGKGYKESNIDVDGYDGNDKVSFAYNHLENGFLDSETVRMNEQNNLTLTIQFPNIDMSILTLNKRFIIRFEDTDTASIYNGTYKLNRCVYGFNNEGSDSNMSLYAICEFKLFKKHKDQ